MIESTGDLKGIKNKGIVEACLENVYQTHFGETKYKSIEEKAARLCYSLITVHGFIDGNKRIGIYVMLIFLEINGKNLNVTDEELIELGLGVAEGSYKYNDILEFIRKN